MYTFKFSFFNFNHSYSEDKLAYIDINYILNNSIVGQSITKHIQNINKNKKFIITNGKELIENYQGNKFKDLPLVYGKEAGKNFSTFYQSLADMNFQMELIKQFNYFDINRWDILLKDGQIYKNLPIQIPWKEVRQSTNN